MSSSPTTAPRVPWRSEITSYTRGKSNAASIASEAALSAPALPRPASPPLPPGIATAASSSAAAAAASAAVAASVAAPPSAAPAPSLPPQRPRPGYALKRFYEEQDRMIEAIEATDARLLARDAQSSGVAGAAAAAEAASAAEAAASSATARWVSFLINLYFICTLCIFVLKVAVAIYSGSLAVIASATECALDVLSNSIIWCSARIARRKNVRKWPIGKTRLEPVAVVIFSSIMGVAALQIIISSLQDIVKVSGDGTLPSLNIDAITFGALGAVLVVKAVLFFLCYAYRASASVAALAQDSLNDMISDVAAIVAIGIVGAVPAAWWVDPAVAMGISVFLIVTWVRTGREHVVGLVGHAADKTQLAQITYLAMNHDARVLGVDTVRAYFVGLKLVVELDIVLPQDMPLRAAHDIGEALQLDVERLDYVERAYVHLDWESSHREHDEHMDVHDD